MNRIHPFIIAIVKIQFIFLVIMSLIRLWFYDHFSPYAVLPETLRGEWLYALWFGLRLDLSVLGYISIVSLLILAIMQLFRSRNRTIRRILTGYFWVVFILISMFLGADMAFYSYFGEHANIMIFGVMDDDTKALLEIAWKNYNIPLLSVLGVLYGIVLWKLITFVFRRTEEVHFRAFSATGKIGIYVVMIALSFLAARGSLGIFPISKYVVDVSSDPFVNQLPQNGVFAIIKSYKQYKTSKSNDYNLIKMMGYENNITEAFRIHLQNRALNPKDLLGSLQQRTRTNPQLEKNPPNVVVIMVESFGMPITQYQSETFDIMGRLKKHFDEDTLFRNFISGSNGTIGSMEPFLLNIAARPESTSFGQSNYVQTVFKQASARVYQSKGYETSYVYGGDLSWRNVGGFMKYQGFDHVEGKGAIVSALKLDETKASHSWGVFDQYAYDFLLKKLSDAKKPQFIYLMTTNNHPPYDIPPEYTSRSLVWSDEMSKHMNGDKALLEKRLHDYAYALDMAGRFMDEIKKNPKFANTVVVITADNNTIESSMKYDDPVATSKLIPFYLYLPKHLKPADIDTSVAGSHKDIFPTLYNLTLSNVDYVSMGVDLLAPNTLHCGFNDAGIIISDRGAFEVDKAKNAYQSECNAYYKATLAAEEYLIRSHMQQKRIEPKE